MKFVKLTDGAMQTYGGCQWEIGRQKKTSGEGELCGPGWLHCYGANTLKQAAALAVLLNPVHANVTDPRMFIAEVGGEMKKDNGVKFGVTEMTLTREISLPEVPTSQRVAFAILCALEVYSEPGFVLWAKDWLSGEDRTAAAETAAAAWAAAAWAAARAEAWDQYDPCALLERLIAVGEHA